MDTIAGTPFPRIDAIRAELCASGFERLSPDEAAHVAERFAIAHHSNAMEDVLPSAETVALFAMFVEERVPVPLARILFLRFMNEEAPGAQQRHSG